MILTICNEKGGTGKTTISFNLAVEFQKHTPNIVLVDADKQQSLTQINQLRTQNKFIIKNIDDITPLQSKKDNIIIDAGGRDNIELRKALAISDICIVVINISQLDIFAIERMKFLINKAQQVNNKIKSFFLLNKITTNKFMYKEIQEFLDVLKGFKVKTFKEMIHERVVYKRSVQDGLGVSETLIKDEKAVREIQRLFKEIFTIIQ
jgi:chromosome partitioning protein